MSSLEEVLPLFNSFCTSVLKNEKKTAIEQYDALLKTKYIDDNALDASKGFRPALVDYIVKKRYKTELFKPTVFNYFLVFIRTLLDESVEDSKLQKLNSNIEGLHTFAVSNEEDTEIQLMFVVLAHSLFAINNQQKNSEIEKTRELVTSYSFSCIDKYKKNASLMAAVCKLLIDYYPKDVKKDDTEQLKAVYDEIEGKLDGETADPSLAPSIREQLGKLVKLLDNKEPKRIDNDPITELLEIHRERADVSLLANEVMSSSNSWNEYCDCRTGNTGLDAYIKLVNWCMGTNNEEIFEILEQIFFRLGDPFRDLATENIDFAASLWDPLLDKVFEYCKQNFKNEKLFVPCTCILRVIFQNSVDRIDEELASKYRSDVRTWHEHYLRNEKAEKHCNHLLLTLRKEFPAPDLSNAPIDLSDGKPWDFRGLDLSSL